MLAPRPAPAQCHRLGKAQQSPAMPPRAPGQGGGGGGRRDRDTNGPESVEHKSLLPSSDCQQKLIFVGETFLCHLSHEWMRETLSLELAQTVPIPTHFSCTVVWLFFFNWFS